MNEETVEKMLVIIDNLTVELLDHSADQWKLEDDRDSMLYRLAFNDGLLEMAIEIKERLKQFIPLKFEVNEDDKS